MARSFTRANSDFLANSGAGITAVPLTIAAFVRSNDVTLSQGIASLVNGAPSSTLAGLQIDISASKARAFASISGGSANAAVGATTLTNGTLYHVCGVFTNSTSRIIYLNGSQDGTASSGPISPSSINKTVIGRFETNPVGNYMDGVIAEVGFWNVLLTPEQIAALARGVSPLRIQPANLVQYYPLYGTGSPEPDYGVNTIRYNLTVTGTAQADHVPVMAPFGLDAAPPIAIPAGTRLYFDSTAPAAVSAAFSGGVWDDTTSAAPLHRRLNLTPQGSPMTTLSFVDASTTDKDIVIGRWVSPPLSGAQVIEQQRARIVLRAAEADAQNNMLVAVYVTLRENNGALWTDLSDAPVRDDVEVATTLTNRYFEFDVWMVEAEDGFRIAVELGLGGASAGTNHASSLRIGDAAASDLPFDDSTTTDLNPYIEFSQTLVFGTEGASTVPRIWEVGSRTTDGGADGRIHEIGPFLT